MKKTVLNFGARGAIAELILFALTWVVIWLFSPSHTIQGYIGWVNLLCPLLFVYFGMRYYRDRQNGGEISVFGALKVGLLITLFPAFAFAFIETLFVTYIEPDFYEKIAKYDLDQYRKTLSPEDFAQKAQDIEKQLALSNEPIFNFLTMVLTVFALGTIISVISALLLKRKLSSPN